MALRDSYVAFLNTPSSGALAENAALHYISTLTTINDATAIIRHLAVQDKLLKKKGQKVLDAVEGECSISLDVETTLEFVSGGGAYLPGLDDNFVSDRTVIFPMVHIVHFNAAGKISQIRLYWDQGSLLKQIDVIGSRSRNWPIRDGKDQSRLISTSSAAVGKVASGSTNSRGPDEEPLASRSRGSTKSSNAMNDPHASLSLFQPRDLNEEDSTDTRQIAPRVQSAKPAPREYSELFVGEDNGSPSPSPQKIPVKAGGGKNYKSNRLFSQQEDEEPVPTPMSVKTNEKKYNHFEFGDGEDTPHVRDTTRPSTRSTHTSNWGFEDFATPSKPGTKTNPQAARNFGWSDDEQEISPVRQPVAHKARKDADTHFEFVDDGTPEAKRAPTISKGAKGNKGQGLYEDHVTHTTNDEDDGHAQGDVKRALGDVSTAVQSKNRSKDFGAHWEVNDNSPAPEKDEKQKAAPHSRKATTNNFDFYQNSPDHRPINIAGNGMGGRKGTEAAWSLYDESPAKKENALGAGASGINITGDGMGGRKGADHFWDF